MLETRQKKRRQEGHRFVAYGAKHSLNFDYYVDILGGQGIPFVGTMTLEPLVGTADGAYLKDRPLDFIILLAVLCWRHLEVSYNLQTNPLPHNLTKSYHYGGEPLFHDTRGK